MWHKSNTFNGWKVQCVQAKNILWWSILIVITSPCDNSFQMVVCEVGTVLVCFLQKMREALSWNIWQCCSTDKWITFQIYLHVFVLNNIFVLITDTLYYLWYHKHMLCTWYSVQPYTYNPKWSKTYIYTLIILFIFRVYFWVVVVVKQ